MTEDLPIDIHYNKLQDWLLSRRHCPQHWQQLVLSIREKINIAIQDMPAVDDVAKLLSGTFINYFLCVEIVNLLKLTEDNSRNIFGRYSSQRLKDWTDIVKLYEKDGIFLAEAAQLLTRNVNFEIPTLKRQIAKCSQAQLDYSKREADYAKLSTELEDKYASSCKQMGIKGQRVKRELLMLVRDMPSTFDHIAAQMKPLNAAVQFYVDFVAFILSDQESSKTRLPLVRYVIQNGNVTAFEYQNGRQPSRVEAMFCELNIDDLNYVESSDQKEDEIDWGDIDSVVHTGSSAFDSTTAIEASEMSAEIDWSAVDDLSSGIEIVGDTFKQQVVDQDADENVARGSDALTLLDNVTTRNGIIDELMELELFLEQRLNEQSVSTSDDLLSAVILQSAPQSVVQIDCQEISAFLLDVRAVLSSLTSQRMRDLMHIRSSPQYVDRLSASLEKLLADSKKMASMSRLMATRRAESVDEQNQLEPQLELVRQKTKELQKHVEAEISKRYKNRRVNIMGEINAI